jgi:hypothetical protein
VEVLEDSILVCSSTKSHGITIHTARDGQVVYRSSSGSNLQPHLHSQGDLLQKLFETVAASNVGPSTVHKSLGRLYISCVFFGCFFFTHNILSFFNTKGEIL